MANNSHFSRLPDVAVPRSRFDMSHNHKTTFDAGNLVPILCHEIVPGDTVEMSASGFARLNTPIHPIMDDLVMDTFFFFVPCRLVWENFQRMCGEQDRKDDHIDYTIPQLTCPGDGWPVGSLADYFGIPVNVPGLDVNALPFRAYNLIYNEWFRDQNLIDSRPSPLGNGPDNDSDYILLRRCKTRDYFTSCLPWPQKGAAVTLPLGQSADIRVTPYAGDDQTPKDNFYVPLRHSNAYCFNGYSPTKGSGGEIQPLDDSWNVYADLSDATAATVNQLRQAFQVQRLLERDARGGTRYVEIIRNHFGVVSDDARLQRPEYLGGGSTDVNITPIAQTSATDQAVSPQGNLSAMGTLSFSNHNFRRSFTEHGYIIGIANVRSRLSYQYGLARMWSRRNRYDLYWPAFSHLGEQAVLNKEIYAQGSADPAKDEEVFGFQERYAEMRYSPTRITGLFRSGVAGSLDVWHLAEDFSELPTLSPEFMVSNPPIDRVVAVPSEPHFIFDIHFKMRCVRPMPTYSVPGFIDQF